jgi:hypothetical protein
LVTSLSLFYRTEEEPKPNFQYHDDHPRKINRYYSKKNNNSSLEPTSTCTAAKRIRLLYSQYHQRTLVYSNSDLSKAKITELDRAELCSTVSFFFGVIMLERST